MLLCHRAECTLCDNNYNDIVQQIFHFGNWTLLRSTCSDTLALGPALVDSGKEVQSRIYDDQQTAIVASELNVCYITLSLTHPASREQQQSCIVCDMSMGSLSESSESCI